MGILSTDLTFFRIDREASIEGQKYVCLKCGWAEKSKQTFTNSHLRVFHGILDEFYDKAPASKKTDLVVFQVQKRSR
jgi:hypothetical protein